MVIPLPKQFFEGLQQFFQCLLHPKISSKTEKKKNQLEIGPNGLNLV
jgi:hypothetical protein